MTAHLWFFYALGAAILWGIGYVLSDKVMEQGISPISMMFYEVLLTLPIMLGIAYFTKALKPGLAVLSNNSYALILFVIMTLSFILGGIFIFKSISLKSATYANIIEISYPAFTIFFSWLFFREFEMSPNAIAGAVLIFIGVLLIYLKG